MAPKRAALPPADFAGRALPIEIVPAGAIFVRIHRTTADPLHFGRSRDNRFDDPDARFGVLYAARSLTGAFAETCLRETGARLIPMSRLAARSATEIGTKRELRLAELHGPGLARMGATADVTSGTYDLSQPWSRAVYDHPAAADGLIYRSKHDNGELCVALFDRCRDRLTAENTRPLLDNRFVLAALLDRYRVGLG